MALVKHLGQEGESTDLYLRAALKFLQAASMLEPVYAEVAKLGEVTQSMIMYHDTAKLCEYVLRAALDRSLICGY